MASNLELDQDVYVPRALIGLDPNTPAGPLLKSKIRQIEDRSVRVDMPHDPLVMSEFVAASKIVLKLGILVVRIGDYKETELVEPLSKSVFFSCRMLTPPGGTDLIEVRTVRELSYLWHQLHAGFEHIILVGHGDKDCVQFGDRNISVKVLAQLFEKPVPTPKEFISLCCKTGQAPFGKVFSGSSACAAFAAPFHSIHGVIASQFCQTYLTNRLLDGLTVGVAFKQAREKLLGAASFRLWQDGKLKAGPK